MLAAGGTGGHLFPAFALAQELGRRGIAVDLITDMRGDRYGMNFPARRTYKVASATPAGRSIVATAGAAAVAIVVPTLDRDMRPQPGNQGLHLPRQDLLIDSPLGKSADR